MIAAVSTHPVQYHAPVFRELAARHRIPLTVVYLSDLSVRPFHEPDFGASIDWGVDLLTGYDSAILRTNDTRPAATLNGPAPELRPMLDRLSPAALILTGYGVPLFRSAIAWAARHRRPVILRAETGDHNLPRNPLRRAVRDLYLRAVYSRVRAFAPIGAQSRRHYLRLGIPAARLFDSPYCVDTTPFRTTDEDRAALREPMRAELGIGLDQTAILFSGKLIPRKAPGILLEAAARLKAQCPGLDPVAVFMGDGPLRAELEASARRLDLPALFTGFRNQRDVSPIFHAADLFCLPSLSGETWGLVVNEALHHGLPVVVSDAVGCATDLVEPGSTGEIAPSGCTDGFANAMARALPLMNSPETRAACRARVARYSVEAAAKGLAEAFESTQQPNWP